MISLREIAERDLHDTVEREWKVPVELIAPDGSIQQYSKNDPTELLGGQVLAFSQRKDPVTGETVIIDTPVISLRISSLDRVPEPGERWFVKTKISPTQTGWSYFFITENRGPEDGTDIGFIRLYLQKADIGEVPVS